MCVTLFMWTQSLEKFWKFWHRTNIRSRYFSQACLWCRICRMQFFFTVAIIYHMDLLLYTVLKPTFILHFLSKHEHGSCITCSSSFLSHSSVSKVMLISKLVSLIIKPSHLLIADTMTMIHSHRVSGADLTWTCNNSLWSQHRDNTVSHFPTS